MGSYSGANPKSGGASFNVFSLLTPVFAIGIAAAFYHERLTGPGIAGVCVVIAGGWITARQSKCGPASAASAKDDPS